MPTCDPTNWREEPCRRCRNGFPRFCARVDNAPCFDCYARNPHYCHVEAARCMAEREADAAEEAEDEAAAAKYKAEREAAAAKKAEQEAAAAAKKAEVRSAEEEAAAKTATAKKAAEEVAAKKMAEEAEAKKAAEEEVAAKKAAEEAATKRAAEKDAAKKAVEEAAARTAAAALKTAEDEAATAAMRRSAKEAVAKAAAKGAAEEASLEKDEAVAAFPSLQAQEGEPAAPRLKPLIICKDVAAKKKTEEEAAESTEKMTEDEKEYDGEGMEVEKEQNEKGDDQDDQKEDPSNLQHTWEILELCNAKKLCGSLLALGEVSSENENYVQALEDLNSCLEKRKDKLPNTLPGSNISSVISSSSSVVLTTSIRLADHKQTAEIQYQLGVALTHHGQFDPGGTSFTKYGAKILEQMDHPLLYESMLDNVLQERDKLPPDRANVYVTAIKSLQYNNNVIGISPFTDQHQLGVALTYCSQFDPGGASSFYEQDECTRERVEEILRTINGGWSGSGVNLNLTAGRLQG